jgi:putative ABC transport system substrate-binding protein
MGVIWPIAGLFYAASISPAAGPIVVAYESNVDAYTAAVAGLDAATAGKLLRIIDLRSATGAGDLTRAIASSDVRLVVAVGSGAVAEVQARRPAVPVLVTMVLHGGGAETAAGHVDLDIPLGMQLEAIRSLLPRATRVGIIRNPARSRQSADAIEERARKDGFTAIVVDCDGPAHLLKALAQLKGRVDFLLCFPDPDLYNAVTIKPLVMASLESRLPLVGFSPAFVRAGAAAGIYPDYRDVGRQTAAMAMRLLRGEAGYLDEPAKVRLAVNQRVARLLGLEFRTASPSVEVFR